MPAQKPKRPDPGHAMLLPRTGADPAGNTVQRAFDAVSTTVQQVQKTVAAVKDAGGGRLLAVRTFTASGTYPKTEGATFAVLHITGGGGAGGSAQGGGGGGVGVGGGGASGITIQVEVTSPVDYVVTIGSPGVPGAAGNNPGGAGGDTTVGQDATTYIARGGGGGSGMASSTLGIVVSGGGLDPSSSPATWFSGNEGQRGRFFVGSTWESGSGGSGARGIGGAGQIGAIAAANAGSGFGAGGAGAAVTTVSASGGAGAPGAVTVYEYS